MQIPGFRFSGRQGFSESDPSIRLFVITVSAKKIRMTCRIALTLALLLTTLAPVTLTADIVIDTFTQGDTLAQIGAGSSSRTTNHPSILGGSREATVSVPAGGVFGLLSFGSGLQIAQGSSDQIQGSLNYQGFSTIDFTENGSNTNFALSITQNGAIQPMNGVFSITVGSGGSDTQVFFDIPAVGTDWVLVDFADFAGVDFTAVDSVQLGFDFTALPGGEVTINRFLVSQGIPEPGMARICLALLTMSFMRRRRTV